MRLPHAPNLSLMALMRAGDRAEDPAETFPLEVERESLGDPGGFDMKMKKKRHAALMMHMLRSQGYDKLADMSSIRETRGDTERDEGNGY